MPGDAFDVPACVLKDVEASNVEEHVGRAARDLGAFERRAVVVC